MTSGQFHFCPIDQIVVNRESRQRRDLQGIEELADSIRRLGLIHPIVLDRSLVLIAGERRLAACRSLGWSDINFQFVDESDPSTLAAIELEENIKRQDISWQDRVQAVAAYHNLRSEEPGWSQDKTAEAIGIVRRYVGEHIQVAKALADPVVASQPKFSTALGIVQRQEARRADAELASFGTGSDQIDPDQSVLCARFEDWIREYSGPKFNLIHCDFPYGIGFDRMGDQAGSAYGRYGDDLDSYKSLLLTFRTTVDLFAEDSCHLIFWFSMQNYGFTYKLLTEGAGFTIDPFPLIWLKSDNVGIIPDSNRGPRRIYEAAFFGSRGDRRIVRPKSNAFAGPTTALIHPHEKPQAMLEYFFEMLVDEHTSLFDPTCGGGSALRAAEALGAKRVLGLEADEAFAQLANVELEKCRA